MARGPESGRPIPPFDIERLRKFLVRDETTGCLNWTGYKDAKGYGKFAISGHSPFQAHRCAYAHAKGPIPPGLSLHHTCQNRACCNPDHLEPVTHAENHARRVQALMVSRGSDSGAYMCKRGHTAFRVDNRGKRTCVVCARAAHDRCMARKRLSQVADAV